MVERLILGVDAAWTDKEPSGVALLKEVPGEKPEIIRVGRSYLEFSSGGVNWNLPVVGSVPNFYDILKTIGKIDVVALDIPLSPYPISCRRKADNIISGLYGNKGASTHTPNENRPGVISTMIFEQLTNQGFVLASKLSSRPSFIEVYPHVAIIELFGYDYRVPYKVQKRSKYWPNESPRVRYMNSVEKLMELKHKLTLEVNGVSDFLIDLDLESHHSIKFLKGYEDMIDSIISALVGYYFLIGKAKAYGDEYGYILVPQKG